MLFRSSFLSSRIVLFSNFPYPLPAATSTRGENSFKILRDLLSGTALKGADGERNVRKGGKMKDRNRYGGRKNKRAHHIRRRRNQRALIAILCLQ